MESDPNSVPGDRRPAAAIPGDLERLRIVFDLVGDAVLVLDLSGRLVEVNRAACERYGYSRPEMLRMHILDLNAPEQRQPAAERFRRVSAEGRLLFETVHEAKDGRPIPTEVDTRRVPLGSAAFVISVCRDLTERRRAEQAARDSEERLRRAERYEPVVRLAGGVAHNVNNLMAVVTGYADMLLESLPQDSPSRGAAEKIRAAGSRAAAIARQLTSYSRRQFIVPKIADIGGVISGMTDALAAVAGNGIALSIEPGPAPLVVEADLDQFGRALEELVANARDASAAGRGSITIRWRRAEIGDGTPTSSGVKIRPGAYALVEVEDNGCGIDPELLPRIFDPFVTSKEYGRGLGLPSIYGFVKQSDGFISVGAAPRRGTIVSLYFPLANASGSRA